MSPIGRLTARYQAVLGDVVIQLPCYCSLDDFRQKNDRFGLVENSPYQRCWDLVSWDKVTPWRACDPLAVDFDSTMSWQWLSRMASAGGRTHVSEKSASGQVNTTWLVTTWLYDGLLPLSGETTTRNMSLCLQWPEQECSPCQPWCCQPYMWHVTLHVFRQPISSVVSGASDVTILTEHHWQWSPQVRRRAACLWYAISPVRLFLERRHSQRASRQSASNHGARRSLRRSTVCNGAKRSAMSHRTLSYVSNRMSTLVSGGRLT